MTTVGSFWEIVEQKAWDNYKKARYLYHLSPIEDDITLAAQKIKNICDNGLSASKLDDNKNAVWLFVNSKWAGDVARSIGVRHFALFRIKKSSISQQFLRWDNVAEICAQVSFYYICQKIEPINISFVNFYSVK